MRTILTWPYAHEWIFSALWVASALIAGFAIFRVMWAARRGQDIPGVAGAQVSARVRRRSMVTWSVAAAVALSSGVVWGRTNWVSWDRWMGRVYPDARMNQPSHLTALSRLQSGSVNDLNAPNAGAIVAALSDRSYATSKELAQWPAQIRRLLQEDALTPQELSRLRTARQLGLTVSAEEADAWTDLATYCLERAPNPPVALEGWMQLRVSRSGDHCELFVGLNDSVLEIPPTMAAGVVVRSIQYQGAEGAWHDFPTLEPLPASAFQTRPIVVLQPEEGRLPWRDYKVCVSGDVIMFSESFPAKHVRLPFRICGDGMRSMP